jgi:hypothetical protein
VLSVADRGGWILSVAGRNKGESCLWLAERWGSLDCFWQKGIVVLL